MDISMAPGYLFDCSDAGDAVLEQYMWTIFQGSQTLLWRHNGRDGVSNH